MNKKLIANKVSVQIGGIHFLEINSHLDKNQASKAESKLLSAEVDSFKGRGVE